MESCFLELSEFLLLLKNLIIGSKFAIKDSLHLDFETLYTLSDSVNKLKLKLKHIITWFNDEILFKYSNFSYSGSKINDKDPYTTYAYWGDLDSLDQI